MHKLKSYADVIHDVKSHAFINDVRRPPTDNEVKSKKVGSALLRHKESVHEAAKKVNEMLELGDIAMAKSWSKRLCLLIRMSSENRM